MIVRANLWVKKDGPLAFLVKPVTFKKLLPLMLTFLPFPARKDFMKVKFHEGRMKNTLHMEKMSGK